MPNPLLDWRITFAIKEQTTYLQRGTNYKWCLDAESWCSRSTSLLCQTLFHVGGRLTHFAHLTHLLLRRQSERNRPLSHRISSKRYLELKSRVSGPYRRASLRSCSRPELLEKWVRHYPLSLGTKVGSLDAISIFINSRESKAIFAE